MHIVWYRCGRGNGAVLQRSIGVVTICYLFCTCLEWSDIASSSFGPPNRVWVRLSSCYTNIFVYSVWYGCVEMKGSSTYCVMYFLSVIGSRMSFRPALSAHSLYEKSIHYSTNALVALLLFPCKPWLPLTQHLHQIIVLD